MPISGRLDIPESADWDFVREALAAINSVHGDGALPTIPVVRNQSRNPAEYIFDRTDGRALRIEARNVTSFPHFIVIHEVGHFLDHQTLGTQGRFASAEGWLSEIMEAIRGSAAISGLHGRIGKRYAMVINAHGRRQRENVSQHHVRYLLEPEEQFARAYAQYIAIRSGDATLLAELSNRRGSILVQRVYYEQWQDTDFVPIAQAFDRLLRRQGWIA